MLLGTSLCFVQWLRLYLKKKIPSDYKAAPFGCHLLQNHQSLGKLSDTSSHTLCQQCLPPCSLSSGCIGMETSLWCWGIHLFLLFPPHLKSGSPTYSVLGACELKGPKKLETWRKNKVKVNSGCSSITQQAQDGSLQKETLSIPKAACHAIFLSKIRSEIQQELSRICPYKLLYSPRFYRNQYVHIGICIPTHSNIHILHKST